LGACVQISGVIEPAAYSCALLDDDNMAIFYKFTNTVGRRTNAKLLRLNFLWNTNSHVISYALNSGVTFTVIANTAFTDLKLPSTSGTIF
jgi:hypothetical protein